MSSDVVYQSKIPGKAVDQGEDLVKPTQDLLRSLNLLPGAGATLGNAGYAFSGPPDSVSILEAGATAATKGWSTAIGLSAAAVSAWIVKVWNGLGANSWNQPFALLAIAVILAAAALGIAYLFAADVRGRALGMKATIEARRDVAVTIIESAASRSGALHVDESHSSFLISLAALEVENEDETTSQAQHGWKALALRSEAGKNQFLISKEQVTKWVDAAHVKFL